jgi:hypothetical protein
MLLDPFTGWVRGGQAGHGADLPAAQRGRGHHLQLSQSDQDRLPAVIGYSTMMAAVGALVRKMFVQIQKDSKN